MSSIVRREVIAGESGNYFSVLDEYGSIHEDWLSEIERFDDIESNALPQTAGETALWASNFDLDVGDLLAVFGQLNDKDVETVHYPPIYEQKVIPRGKPLPRSAVLEDDWNSHLQNLIDIPVKDMQSIPEGELEKLIPPARHPLIREKSGVALPSLGVSPARMEELRSGYRKVPEGTKKRRPPKKRQAFFLVKPARQETRIKEIIPWSHGMSSSALIDLVRDKKAKIVCVHRQVTQSMFVRSVHVVRTSEIRQSFAEARDGEMVLTSVIHTSSADPFGEVITIAES